MSQIKIDSKATKNAFDLLDYKREGIVNIEEVLSNMVKLGLDKTHPEIFDLVESLGNNKINYNDFELTLNELMRQKEDDNGLQRMFDLLIFNPNEPTIDFDLLKKIGNETGNPLTDYEIIYLLNKAGDGKKISLESFINFMKK